MKKRLSALFIIMLISVLSVNGYAQETDQHYKLALGLKLGDGGISFKYFMSDKHALEGIFSWGSTFRRTTLLYEIHGNIKKAPGLRWYAGPGVHMHFYNNKYILRRNIFGADCIMGLDYKFRNLPFNVSIDWQPSVDFDNHLWHTTTTRSLGGVGIRYTF